MTVTVPRFLMLIHMLRVSVVTQSLNGSNTPLCKVGDCTEYTTTPTPTCPQGYYGSNCTYICSEFCMGSQCEASDTGVGACTEGCIHGYWGETCRSQCAQVCDGCDRKTGVCIACKLSLSCNENCLKLCPNSYCKCTSVSQDPCLEGKFGSKCQWGCPKFCHDNICNRKSGLCISGCKKGYFGSKCEFKCNSNCRQRKCTNDGNCSEGCDVRFYGEFCEQQCSENCRFHTCERHGGDCSSGCADGYFGPRCNRTCPRCAMCDGRTGVCLQADAENHRDSHLILISATVGASVILVGFIIIVVLYRSKISSRQQYLRAVVPMSLPTSVNSTYNRDYDVINEQEVVLENLSNSFPTINGSSIGERRDETDLTTDQAPIRNQERVVFRTL